MKKFALSALALVAFAGAANADINFRIVAIPTSPIASAGSQAESAQNDPNGGGVNTFGSSLFLNNGLASGAAPATRTGTRNIVNAAQAANPTFLSIDTSGGVGQRVIFVVQASWTGITGANGLASVGSTIATNQAVGGATITRYLEQWQTTANIEEATAPSTFVHGHFGPYNGLSALDPENPGANGSVSNVGGNWSVTHAGFQVGGTPLSLATGVWDNVFAFAFTNLDATARTVTFSLADLAQVSSAYQGVVNGQPNAIASGALGTASFEIRIVPAPGAAALLGIGGLLAARRRRA